MAIRGFTYTYAALSLPLDYGKIIIVVSRQHRHKTGTEGLGLTNYQININAGTCRASSTLQGHSRVGTRVSINSRCIAYDSLLRTSTCCIEKPGSIQSASMHQSS
jgi:hypothetical protein